MSTERTLGRVLLFSVPFVFFVVVAQMILSAGRQAFSGPPTQQRSSVVRFDADGKLVRPVGYRRWIHVGTPLTPHDMNGGMAAFPEFHNVYINPAAYDAFERTGVFPDGTVLVKELISVGSKSASSGKGYFMGDFIGLEVSIKGSRRFKEEPGNWAFFSFGHEYPLLDATTIQPAANCNACHGGIAEDDYVFTQYYPVLRDAGRGLREAKP